MDATFILDTIRLKYPKAAIVPELSINDPSWHDWKDQLPLEDLLKMKPYRRIDALMMQTFERTAIEIKISKADFNNDSYHKRRPWQRVTHRFIYAVPHDLDVMSPHGCGLWKIHEDGSIEIVKKAIIQKHPEPLPQDVIQRLMYRAAGTPFSE